MTDNFRILFSIFILSVVVERIVELLHASKFFLPFRNQVSLIAYPPDAPPLEPFGWSAIFSSQHVGRRLAHFVDAVFGCGYCASVWVAMAVAYWCPLPFNASGFFGWVIRVVLLHGVSNLYHVLYERQKKWSTHPRPFHLMLDIRTIEDNEVNNESEGQ